MVIQKLAKRYLIIICLGMALTAGGCASIEQRAAHRIEYIVPQTKAAPGDVFHLSYVLPSQVKSGRAAFLQKKYYLFPPGFKSSGTNYSLNIKCKRSVRDTILKRGRKNNDTDNTLGPDSQG